MRLTLPKEGGQNTKELMFLLVAIGTDGMLQSAQVVNSLDPSLDQKAIGAGNQWHCKPGMLKKKAGALCELPLNSVFA